MSNFLTTIRKAAATLAALGLTAFLLTSCGGGNGIGAINCVLNPDHEDCPCREGDTREKCRMRIIPDNRPPVTIGVIPEQTVTVGQSKTISLAGYFRDPDGDPLTYSLNYSRTPENQRGNVRATISGASLRIEGVASPGQVVIVVATDPGKLSAQLQVGLRVQAATSQNGSDNDDGGNGNGGQANRAPQARGTIPDQTLRVGQTARIDLSGYFTDPDDDRLRYSLRFSQGHENNVRTSVSGNILEIRGVASPGAGIAVDATDSGDLSASRSFRVNVQSGSGSGSGGQDNRAPQTRGTIPDQTVRVGQTVRIDLSNYFTDPDGDTLTYSLRFSPGQENDVRTSVSGNTLQIEGVAEPGPNIEVTARDRSGGTVSQSHFRVTVSPSEYVGWGLGETDDDSSWGLAVRASAAEAERAALNICAESLGSTCRGWDGGSASGNHTNGCVAIAVSECPRDSCTDPARGLAEDSTRAAAETAAVAECESGTNSATRGTCRVETARDGGPGVLCAGVE